MKNEAGFAYEASLRLTERNPRFASCERSERFMAQRAALYEQREGFAYKTRRGIV